jgi:hypothetical protein
MFASLAGAVRLAGHLVSVVIGVGIVLVVLDARESGQLVGPWLDVCRLLTEPFDRLVDLERGREHLQIAINWAIAALVYHAVARVLAALLVRVSRPRARRR